MKQKLFKNFTGLDTLPSWQECLDSLNYNLSKINFDPKRSNLENEVQNLPKGTFCIRRGKKPFKVNDVRRKIHDLQPESERCSCLIFISLFENSHTFPRHIDSYDVYIVQAQGLTKYILEEDGEELHEYILEPGDALYIPKDVYHSIFPITPRISLSYGFERKYGVSYETNES